MELAYRDDSGVPYHAALCDAFEKIRAGMALVLARIADTLKAWGCQSFERWVFARHIDPFDWKTN